MKSTKEMYITVDKPEDCYKMSDEERQKVLLRISTEVYELIERFDGYCRVKISITVKMEGKGNC